MRRRFVVFLLGFTALAPALAAPPVAAPVSALINAVNLPFDQFTLPNGLRVVVHTDRKAPVVAVAVWYHIGSKDEPAGKSGFAHLFEHLMFAGAAHAPGSVVEQMQKLGATDLNGSTYFDRTNYFETVPTAALDRALFIESDRMGYLLGAVPQSVLDVQRGVVQNEKRQRDNQPYGLVEYSELNIFPEGHPYQHTAIGSMADLDKASLGDVRAWFHDHYGPNNAVLVLAGDIDLASAKEKATHWFGELPRGPAVVHPAVAIPTLPAPRTITLHDNVATTRIIREWAIPGDGDKDSVALDMAASVLGGLASSRFDNALVRGQQLAVSASAAADKYENVGLFQLTMDVKPGVDADAAAKAMDAVFAQFLAEGPKPEELKRAATRAAEATITSLESVHGQGLTLADGAVYDNDPGFFKKQLAELATITPQQVRDVARHWLNHPAYTMIVRAGPREPYAETRVHSIAARAPAPDLAPDSQRVAVERAVPPEVASLTSLVFPAIERTTLSNGIKVYFARRDAVPTVAVAMSFDAGYAADPVDKLGAQHLMLSLLTQGTTARTAQQIAEESEALGAHINSGATLDRTTLTLDALTPNLAASLDLFADVVLHPAFKPKEVARLRDETLAEIDAANKGPIERARRAIAVALYGPKHPYGRSASGLGSAAVVSTLSPADLSAIYRQTLRPDTADLFVVGDTTLATITPLLEQRFGHWAAPDVPKLVKDFSIDVPAADPRIILLDRPQSPQSYIVAAHVLSRLTGRDDLLTLRAANDVLGGSFLSRINADLREAKSWSYGSHSAIGNNQHQIAFSVVAPVQADKTGAAIVEILAQTKGFLGAQGVSPDEHERTIDAAVRALPGEFETADAVLAGIENIVEFGRPDDYYTRLPARYNAMSATDIDTAARKDVDASKLVFVVVGDAKTVRPQLDGLGLKVETGE